MIPSVAQCRALMTQYRMLDNIRAHSFVVARVAALLANGLREAGSTVALDLTIAGALLHDIGKTPCLDTNENHALVGRDICLRHGFFELAEIVAEHVVLQGGISETGGSVKEIVNYADKRVLHDQVVSLEERQQYIIERYGKNDARLCELIKENFQAIRKLEQRIFGQLTFGPEILAACILEPASFDFLPSPLEQCV
jgi:putative nucleotidyltransferase with HDIG domain